MPAITDPNLLAQLNGGAPSRPQAPQVGAPIFTVPKKPGEDVRLQKDVVDLGRAQKAAQLDTVKAQREQIDLDARRREMAITGGVDTTEAEKVAAFLATRVSGGMSQMAKLGGVGAVPSLGAEAVRKVFGDTPANYMTGSDRQRVEAAQIDVLDAGLTLGTGAAYTKEQIEGYRKSYFPQLGDKPETVADKKERLRLLLEAAKVKAGKSAPAIEQALAQAGFVSPTGVQTGEKPESYRFSPDQEQQINRYLQSPTATAQGYSDMISGFAQDQGVPVDDAYRQSAITEGARVIKGLRSGGKLSGGTSYEEADESYIKAIGVPERSNSGLDAFVRGVADTATLGFADEIAAGGDTLFFGGSYKDNLARQRGVDRADEEQNGWLRLAGQVGGGFGLPVGGARTAGGLAKVGAAYGGAYGVGSGEGDLGDRLESGLGGAVTGGALGYGLGKVIGKFGNRTPPPSGPSGADVFDAGQRLGIDALPADVGGPVTGMLTATARATPGGAYSVTSAARRIQDQAMNARDKVAARYGEAQSPVFAGEVAREGALKYRTESRDQIGRLYDRAKAAAGDTKIKPESTLAALDQNISELSQVPGANTALTRLSDLRADIAKRGSLSIDGVRGMRTQLRQDFVKDGLRGSDLERRVNQAIDATVDDMAASLSKAGKGQAASLFKEADTKWKERIETLDKFIMPIIGKQGEKSGEEVFKALQSASKGNSDRMSRFMSALPDQEFRTVSASLIGALGRSAPGRQNAAGNAFSLETFLTNWNEMSPKAKNFIARGPARSALNDLATYAEGAKRAGAYTNYSNTGLATMTAATGATAFADMGLLGATLAAQTGAGLLLSSPKVAAGLARLARAKSPSAKSKAIDSLTQAAVKQPALAPDIMQLQKSLYEAFSQSPGRLAASNNENDTRIEPPQQ